MGVGGRSDAFNYCPHESCTYKATYKKPHIINKGIDNLCFLFCMIAPAIYCRCIDTSILFTKRKRQCVVSHNRYCATHNIKNTHILRMLKKHPQNMGVFIICFSSACFVHFTLCILSACTLQNERVRTGARCLRAPRLCLRYAVQ